MKIWTNRGKKEKGKLKKSTKKKVKKKALKQRSEIKDSQIKESKVGKVASRKKERQRERKKEKYLCKRSKSDMMRTNFCHVVKQRLIYFCLFSLLYRTRNRAMEDGFKRNIKRKTTEK